jgi:hypothetical protein
MAINNFNVGVGTTSQLTRYRYVATGGETSISGTDADGKTLSYTVGLEQVFLNGVNLVRGQDYTATNGTSIGSLTALVASDSLEVFAYVPFNIANALTVSTVDAKGDLLVGTGADAVGRLAVGTANQLLAVDSSTASGLKWANGGMTLISTQTFSAASSVNVDNVFTTTYTNYRILLNYLGSTTIDVSLRFREAGVDYSGAQYYITRNIVDNTPSSSVSKSTGQTSTGLIGVGQTAVKNYNVIEVQNPKQATPTTGYFQMPYSLNTTNLRYDQGYFGVNVTDDFDGFTIILNTGNITGSVSIYGYNI